MFENPLIFVAALVLLAVLLFLRKKEKGKTQDDAQAEVPTKKQSNKKQAASRKKQAVKSVPASAKVKEEPSESVLEDEIVDEAEHFKLEDNWNTAQEVEVSVEQVDDLAEYNVYKQFGYYDQAAKSLGSYLANQENPPKDLVVELCGLYLEAGEISGFVESLENYNQVFERAELEEIVMMGFELDSENLNLRVFAEDELGWGVDEIEQKIAREENIESIPVLEEPVEEVVQNSFKDEHSKQVKDYTAEVGLDLVKGFARISELNMEEKVAILAFSTDEKAVRLVAPSLDYATAVTLFRRGLSHAKRPASILMEALRQDFRYRSLDNYAQNLWSLYYYLGQYGRSVKEKMLSWGYSLGTHPVFAELEGATTDYQVRDIGTRFGYMEENISQVKGKLLPLIEEVREAHSNNVLSEAGEVMQEAEAQLSYGQVDEAINTLEMGILAEPTESQLYSMLFDLYERSEAWSRFDAFSTQVRARGSELPEEVKVMFSRLAQRMNKGGRN